MGLLLTAFSLHAASALRIHSGKTLSNVDIAPTLSQQRRAKACWRIPQRSRAIRLTTEWREKALKTRGGAKLRRTTATKISDADVALTLSQQRRAKASWLIPRRERALSLTKQWRREKGLKTRGGARLRRAGTTLSDGDVAPTLSEQRRAAAAWRIPQRSRAIRLTTEWREKALKTRGGAAATQPLFSRAPAYALLAAIAADSFLKTGGAKHILVACGAALVAHTAWSLVQHLRALRASLLERRAAAAEKDAMPWDKAAATRLGRVPGFVRGRARATTERYARERGHGKVTDKVFLACRDASG